MARRSVKMSERRMLHVRVSYVVVIASMCLITKDTWSRSGAEPARARESEQE
jgi:hypothetical protein